MVHRPTALRHFNRTPGHEVCDAVPNAVVAFHVVVDRAKGVPGHGDIFHFRVDNGHGVDQKAVLGAGDLGGQGIRVHQKTVQIGQVPADVFGRDALAGLLLIGLGQLGGVGLHGVAVPIGGHLGEGDAPEGDHQGNDKDCHDAEITLFLLRMAALLSVGQGLPADGASFFV